MQPSSRRCFLAIGLQNYNSKEGLTAADAARLKPLKNAKADAASLETLFKQWGYRTQLSCDLCSFGELEAALKKFREKVQVDTEVIVTYVVGHGITPNGKPRLLLLNATTQNDSCDEKSVEVKYLMDQLLGMNSRQDCFVLLMNDFCRSAISDMAQQEIEGKQERWLRQRYAILWSTSANRPARDGEPQDGLGPFVQGFRDCVGRGNLSLDKLRDDLTEHVLQKTRGEQKIRFYSGSLDRVPPLFGEDRSCMASSTGSTTMSTDPADPETRSRSLLTQSTSSQNPCVRRSCSCGRRAFGLLICLVCASATAVAASLLIVNGQTIQSCTFGPWQTGPCNATCGGGYQKQRRSTSQACPAALQRTETRMQQCNILACPGNCCFFHACPVRADLLCNDTSCHPFINMTVCEYGDVQEYFDSTVQGREVRWTFGFKDVVTLLDKDTEIRSTNKLNKTAKWESKQAVCQCLEDFAMAVLGKDFSGSCMEFREAHKPASVVHLRGINRNHAPFLIWNTSPASSVGLTYK